MSTLTVRKARIRRHNRVRTKVTGTAERPRLVVFRSNRGIEAQLVDDLEGRTLAAASWLHLRSFKGAKRAQAQGPEKLEIAVGFSHPVYVQAPPGITFEVPQPTRITVRGFDKQLVGQVAADIRKIRKPEPYKGKGIRYANERVLRKAGKSAK